MQTTQRIFIYTQSLTCKFNYFSTRNSESFDISHAFLPLAVAKLLTLKNSPVFWSTLYIKFIHRINFTDRSPREIMKKNEMQFFLISANFPMSI